MILYIIIICCLVLFILYEIYELNALSVSKYEIKIDKISDEFNNFKIVHISDLHSKSFGKDNVKLINKIGLLNPDVIFLTGDIIDKNEKTFDKDINLIKKLSLKYKVYYVFGNHELLLKNIDVEEYINKLKELNVNLLLDEKIKIVKNDSFINLYGLNYKPKIEKNQISLLSKINEDEVNMLLMHDPDLIESILKYNFDLVFSGHIHGGIIRIGKFGIFSPNKLIFPKYVFGVYEKNKTKLIVSRGLGKSRAKIRINNLPEIVCVNLKNK